MSRLISQLLGTDRRTLQDVIERLEHMALQAGVDTRLTAEIITSAREKSRRLSMDPADTTTEELYYGLLAEAERGSAQLAEALGVYAHTKPADAAVLLANATQKVLQKERVVCMQPVAVKKILKAVPPKKTLRLLHFRSIDSVLKRENPLVLYALAKRLEDSTWEKQVQARLKRLQPKDVEECPVQILSLPDEWLDKLKKLEFDSVLQVVAETGSVLLLPTLPIHVPGAVLLTTSLVLQAGQRLAVESLPFRAQALHTGLEKLLPEIAAGTLQELKPIHGMKPSWHAVYQLLATHSRDRLPEFEFVLSDISWESTETRLSALSSDLDFWVNTHYLGVISAKGMPVSMHVVDIAASLVLHKRYGEQVVSHMRSSIWNELQLRYLMHDSFENALISQLTLSQEVVL